MFTLFTLFTERKKKQKRKRLLLLFSNSDGNIRYDSTNPLPSVTFTYDSTGTSDEELRRMGSRITLSLGWKELFQIL